MAKKIKTYYCDIVIKFGGNGMQATSKKDYIKQLTEGFANEFNIKLADHEIINIEEVESE